ncbi:hypothetical protein FRC17_002926 [Serendipita sp. 399]|nr:hypothetical protein FRC17_002926 [Serendipita sp. 399]
MTGRRMRDLLREVKLRENGIESRDSIVVWDPSVSGIDNVDRKWVGGWVEGGLKDEGQENWDLLHVEASDRSEKAKGFSQLSDYEACRLVEVAEVKEEKGEDGDGVKKNQDEENGLSIQEDVTDEAKHEQRQDHAQVSKQVYLCLDTVFFVFTGNYSIALITRWVGKGQMD